MNSDYTGHRFPSQVTGHAVWLFAIDSRSAFETWICWPNVES